MIRAIVTDIEGTTSSLSFVKEVLFPYARRHLADFVRQHHGEAEVARQLQAVREMMAEEQRTDASQFSLEDLIQQLEQWIDADRKATPLKALQGLIWEAGYQGGDFHGHVYVDAEAALRRWHDQGVRLYVYSSGSVYAQKLLFAHTEYGDLTTLFSAYFDTTTGPKQAPASYTNIVEELALPAEEILFLSDIEAELDAAAAAGMQTLWLMRDGAIEPGAAHRQVRDFSAITL